MTEIVLAFLMVFTGNGTYVLETVTSMPLSQCLDEAGKVNFDDTHNYVMFCGPAGETVEG